MDNKQENRGMAPWWKTLRTIVTGIIIILAFISAYFIWYYEFRPFVSTDDARIGADIVNIANTGASGQILSIYAREGDKVTNGMLLLEIDHRTADSQYKQAKARFELADATFNRAIALSNQAGFIKQQYDVARSDVNIARANMDLAEIALERTYLKSPVNGIVIQKTAMPGNILEANQVAYTVVDIEHAWISANISEKSIALVRQGQPVEIDVDEGSKLNGRVTEIRKATASVFSLISPDNASGNFIKVTQRIPIKIELDSHPGTILRVGESVEIKIKILEKLNWGASHGK